MARSLQATIGFIILTLSAGAATRPIGSVSAPGDFRLDTYAVQSSATIFDGSLIETTQAAVDVKLNQHVQIRIATDSRGKIFANRMILLAGESDIAAYSPYSVDASGLSVTSGAAESRGRISIHSDRTVQVSAIAGALSVKDGNGRLIAELHPGNSLRFAESPDAQSAPSPKVITVRGILVSENGKFYLQETDSIRYELLGNIPAKYIGKKIVVRGAMQPAGPDGTSAIQVSAFSEASKVGDMSTPAKWIIVGTGAAAAAIPIVYYSTRSSTPASR